MAKRDKLKPLVLGKLPIDALKKAGIAVGGGDVVFSIAAQKHAISRHAHEFKMCRPYLALAVNSPTHVGQGPEHKNLGFELIYEQVDGDIIVLVAVHLEPRSDGTYIVKSAYPINRNTLERRIRKKFVMLAK
ncbi:hypothetical protein [Sinorhizobium americanum]|uniref:hypothetical protein n=1 Tax=Sinorhizobium americanum TaxID=194963 RepID=UPI0005617AF8|nr:hypothetical protein [Sinorhizobium americanum]